MSEQPDTKSLATAPRFCRYCAHCDWYIDTDATMALAQRKLCPACNKPTVPACWPEGYTPGSVSARIDPEALII